MVWLCSGVPDAPVIPSSLPFLRGERADLLASALQGKAILYCFFRASEYDTNLSYCPSYPRPLYPTILSTIHLSTMLYQCLFVYLYHHA